MEYLIKLLGSVTLEWVIISIAAIVFLWSVYKKVETYFSARAIAEKEKNDEFQKVIEQTRQYPKWHQQSLAIQTKFTEAIEELKDGQKECSVRLERMETENKGRELNKLRDRILQSYRYYTSVEKNPDKAWSEMEADAFWRMFGDYEDLGGDGYIHSDVQPAMNSLRVIRMEDYDALSQLMHSRK